MWLITNEYDKSVFKSWTRGSKGMIRGGAELLTTLVSHNDCGQGWRIMGLKAPFGLLKEHTHTYLKTAFTMYLPSCFKKPRVDAELGALLLPAMLLANSPQHLMRRLQSPPLAFLRTCQALCFHKCCLFCLESCSRLRRHGIHLVHDHLSITFLVKPSVSFFLFSSHKAVTGSPLESWAYPIEFFPHMVTVCLSIFPTGMLVP